MKHLAIIMACMLLLAFSCLNAQPKGEVLTNESVIKLCQMGFDTSIIISKIKSSKSTFDVSMNALIALKKSKVPNSVMVAMINATNNPNNAMVITNPNDPLSPHPSGIYYARKLDSVKLFELEPSVYSQSTSSGYLGQAYTYGLAQVKYRQTLDGAHARFQIGTSQPVFYFYFAKGKNTLNNSGLWWFTQASSPNEFQLIKLNSKNKTREVVVGAYNALGASEGVDDKNKAVFQLEKLSDGIYRVYFTEPLAVGEYCFMYAGGSNVGASPIQKVFDFGIQ